MRVTDIQALFDYNTWGNERLLNIAAAIPTAAFTAPTRFPCGSLRGSFRHLLGAIYFHLPQWPGNPQLPDLAADDFPDLPSLAQQLARAEAQLRAYLATLADADLDLPHTISLGDGYSATAPLWLLMMHVINHGTQHRSDIAQMLTELGHSPGDLDLIDMLPITPPS
ncbi:MAG: DinB family protein [Chloroflexia bacterium]